MRGLKFDNYKGSKGKTYKSDYRAILSWVADKVTKEQPQRQTQSVGRAVPDGINLDFSAGEDW